MSANRIISAVFFAGLGLGLRYTGLLGCVIEYSLTTIVLIAGLAFSWYKYSQYKHKKDLVVLEKWSEENKLKIDKSNPGPKPFKIEFDKGEWDLLVQKLKLSRYIQPLDSKIVPINDHGFDPDYAKKMVEYWSTKYNWSERINTLNRFPQFRIQVDDITLHYVRYKTNEHTKNIKTEVPLLIMDGWPGSFFGFYKMIDYIEETYPEFSFDIIIPSIPGYGYSTPLNRPHDYIDCARLFDGLMRYVHGETTSYYVHGEDWGSIITSALGQMYPSRVKGINVTMPSMPSLADPAFLGHLIAGSYSRDSVESYAELENGFNFTFKEFFVGLMRKTGYFHMQATKPDTLGTALEDSPVGLLAYILEKYQLATFAYAAYGKKDGNLDTLDQNELFDILTYYWMTNSITSSMRLYRSFVYVENKYPRNVVSGHFTPEKLPVSVHYFKNEVNKIPLKLLKIMNPNLKSYKLEKFGGHFAGWENPQTVGRGFIEFVKSVL